MMVGKGARRLAVVLSATTLGLATVAAAVSTLAPEAGALATGAARATTTGAPAATTVAPAATSPSSGMYYLAMGDSLGYGYKASSPSKDYVNLIAQHEQARFPGLQVENESCPGATTGSVLNGGTSCTYASGTQLGDAEAFLRAHSGQIAFVTIDIGANNVDGCVPNGNVDLTCVEKGIAAMQSQLPQILAGLQQADPGVIVFGMNYYDPFLAEWLTGSGGQTIARLSVTLADTFNHDLDVVYGADGYPTADVATAFATDDLTMTGSYNGQSLPQNVANICHWTYMCTNATIHANDTGYALIAAAFEQQIGAWFAGGGPGVVLAARGGNAYALGNALFYGGVAGASSNAPVVGAAGTPSHHGYWLAAADGGVFTFGDAGFYGSMGGKSLNAPVVGIAVDPATGGYWLAAADGGIFSFDAPFLGSEGGKTLNAPVSSVVATDGGGYLEAAADGGVFTFGDAPFPGSMTTQALPSPVVAVAGT